MSLNQVWPQLLLLASSYGAAASPISGVQQPLQAPETQLRKRELKGRFLHITDFHPDQFYKPHTSTEEGIACHRKEGLAGTYGAEATDCDSPFTLIDATFEWISKNLKNEIDFIVWTGDSARHDSDEDHPRDTNQVLSTNRMVADKFLDTFSHFGQLTIPVIPTFGNNDFLPHNIFYPGPNKWLHAYSDIWRHFIPEEQRHSFEFGGWFWTEVIPNHLAVFSLNTMYFFDRNAGVDGCAAPSEPGFRHMEWLRVQLQRMRDRGMKAILIGHVPPARTPGKQNWDETCWQKYTMWLQKYRDVVTGSLYGHMNIDHFLLQDTKEIDLALDAFSEQTRTSLDLEDSISIRSKQDYLQELVKKWSDLPSSVVKAFDEDDELSASKKSKKKHKKHKDKDHFKKIGGKYAERYQLSLVSPSVVPNYFPTLRVFDYNITGLEKASTWTDSFDEASFNASSLASPWRGEGEDTHQELRRDLEAEKKKKKKGKKHKKPKDPNLILPDDPPQSALPGPAYKNQQLTLTGYTQYFANLTYINNDLIDSGIGGTGWRDGDHDDDKEPKHDPPRPRDFEFQVEYNTFEDKVYKLKDLTVRSYLQLAYRIGRHDSGKSKGKSADMLDEESDDDSDLDDEDSGTDVDDLEEDDEDGDSDDDDLESVQGGKKHKKKKGKKRKGKHNHNKPWVTFLNRAFVSTISKKQLKKM